MWREPYRLLGALGLTLALCLGAPHGLAQEGDDGADAPETTLETSDERPLRASTVRLTVRHGLAPAAGARVTAIYRPNSTTSVSEELTPVDASGTLMWTPTHTGPVTLEVRPAGADPETPAVASHTVAVRYGGLPASGLLIMVVAGVLLFGGAAVSFILLLKNPDYLPVEEPPST